MNEIINKILNETFERNQVSDSIEIYCNDENSEYYMTYSFQIHDDDLDEGEDVISDKFQLIEDLYAGVQETEGITENQRKIMSTLNRYRDAKVDKNLITLYLVKCENPKIMSKIKNIVFDIEESAYYFKRQVLTYTNKEYESLSVLLNENENDIVEFLNMKLLDEECYIELRDSDDMDNYYSLLVKMFIKFPFLTLIRDENNTETLIRIDEIISETITDDDFYRNMIDVYKNQLNNEQENRAAKREGNNERIETYNLNEFYLDKISDMLPSLPQLTKKERLDNVDSKYHQFLKDYDEKDDGSNSKSVKVYE